MAFRVFLVTEYDGTDFVGYQFQNNGRSVQGELNRALSEVYKTEIKTVGCSRTDAETEDQGHDFLAHKGIFPFCVNM